MRALITRPEVDAKVLAHELAALDIESITAPLLDIEIAPGSELDISGVQALLFTSANGVRAFCQRSGVRNLLVLCVGDATAREAKAQEFQNIKSAAGDVTTLAMLAIKTCKPDAGALLHAAGTRVAGDLQGTLEKAGFKVRREVLYAARMATRLPAAAADALQAGRVDVVLLYSPRTAEQFARLVTDAGLGEKLSAVTAACLSQAVAEKVRHLGWAGVAVAATPDQNALLALFTQQGDS